MSIFIWYLLFVSIKQIKGSTYKEINKSIMAFLQINGLYKFITVCGPSDLFGLTFAIGLNHTYNVALKIKTQQHEKDYLVIIFAL